MWSSERIHKNLATLLCSVILELCSNALLAEAAIRSNGGNINNAAKGPAVKHSHQHPSHSNNVAVKHSEGTTFSAELEYKYILPEQTIFDTPEELMASRVLLTSPPRLTIQPSVVEDHSYTENLYQQKQFGARVSNRISLNPSLKPEACISETPTFPFVASSFAAELRTGVQYVITAGRIETASSTDLVNDIPGLAAAASIMSQPSTVLHGTTVSNTKTVSGQPHF